MPIDTYASVFVADEYVVARVTVIPFLFGSLGVVGPTVPVVSARAFDQ
jgi:hypothetical protein